MGPQLHPRQNRPSIDKRLLSQLSSLEQRALNGDKSSVISVPLTKLLPFPCVPSAEATDRAFAGPQRVADGFSGFVLLNLEIPGFRVCAYKP